MSEKTLRLHILSPEKDFLDVDAVSVQLELKDGKSIGILPGHAPLLAATERGEIRYLDADGVQNEIDVSSGILWIRKNEVMVLINFEQSADGVFEGEDLPLERFMEQTMISMLSGRNGPG